jgi:hypothetical protein
MIPKGAALPLTFGGLGVGYFLLTYLNRPSEADPVARAAWERHARDAKVALFFGLAAGTILWVARPQPQARHSWY